MPCELRIQAKWFPWFSLLVECASIGAMNGATMRSLQKWAVLLLCLGFFLASCRHMKSAASIEQEMTQTNFCETQGYSISLVSSSLLEISVKVDTWPWYLRLPLGLLYVMGVLSGLLFVLTLATRETMEAREINRKIIPGFLVGAVLLISLGMGLDTLDDKIKTYTIKSDTRTFRESLDGVELRSFSIPEAASVYIFSHRPSSGKNSSPARYRIILDVKGEQVELLNVEDVMVADYLVSLVANRAQVTLGPRVDE
jgi:hypothetical protein